MHYNVIRAEETGATDITQEVIAQTRACLEADGWALLRGFKSDMNGFSELTAQLCTTITFDPAREYSEKNTQKVDAGLGPVGLHIENGNTPICPDIVAFYCTRAAFEGSQTTICDGRAVFEKFDAGQKARWSQKMKVKRNLPEELWKRYLANEHPAISHPDEVTEEHIIQFKAAIPGQDFTLRDDGSIDYELTVSPVRPSSLTNGQAFANAILGPSHNYEKPEYMLEDGSTVSPVEIEALRELAESCTVEINWQDGDIAVIDNTRVMHGRRAIKDADRQLFIGMGRV
ncbi:hypothetical protein C6W92_15020 [Roseovarius sp. A46]|uniref:TauD/TfdA family dioxygenase n=1 Tax=Roseovarius sp. A46 TaxID=2109331 RepID=UPI001011A7DE|nr:TauD/TfdA family dioxygenase [Roseovarius sp. A46]RXV59469.1 hypothetical protein C6W92_15020 [Roseovarius sp. A46]